MKNIIIAGCLLAASVAIADDKFIYDVPSGNIIEITPAATVGSGDKIFGSHVWTIKDGSPALGSAPTLFDENTNQYSNVSQVPGWTNLWPITEEQRQAAKDEGLKTLENEFVTYYESLGFMAKPGFEEITAELQTWTNQLEAAQQAIYGLSIDAAAKRYNPLWWDDCAWHPEMAE